MGMVRDGFEIVEAFIPSELVNTALLELENSEELYSMCGVRNAEAKFKFVGRICASEFVQGKLKQYLPGKAQLVRAIVFDKTLESNWFVAWHQDKTVALSEKMEMPGWGPWSVKDGVVHVQPPLQVLENMLTFRIHLDPAGKKNGCLKVVPKSHEIGVIDQNEIASIVESSEVRFCEIGAGGAVLMRPHILHSSSKSKSGGHRRVLHLEYSNYQLESGLKWAASITKRKAPIS